ncbi:MAG: hypothetical protein GX875_00440 [Propionibacterium sp.]|nr:hypothetical protein [Propionibacterium sp.]
MLLINEFFSPRTNRRDDEYGRGENGRARFALEIVDGPGKHWAVTIQ